MSGWFATGSADALANAVVPLLREPGRREALRRAGHERAVRFDWSSVSKQIMAVYETVIAGADGEPALPTRQGLWGRLGRGMPGTGAS